MKQIPKQLTSLISSNISQVDNLLIRQLLEKIYLTDKIIFITGAGRSKLVGEFFAMRLMHLGKTVHIVGNVCTPSIQAGDILIALSGSGRTTSVVTTCKMASDYGAYLILITSDKESKLAKLSDLTIPLNCTNTKELHYAPMGTIFEVTALMFLESLIGEFMFEYDISEKQLQQRHANLE